MNCKKVSINPNNHEFIITDIHRFICRLIVWSSEDRLFSWLASQVIGWRSVSSLWRMDCYCCSVAKLCLTLCNPMDCSRPGFPVLHYLLEFAQTHVHWVGDAIQPSHPLSSSPPALNLSQHQGLFQWVGPLHQVDKVLELKSGISVLLNWCFLHGSYETLLWGSYLWWEFS